jgi:hypothetical protein
MMCENNEQLLGYLYGELDSDDRGQFEAHIATCIECRAEIESLRTLRGHLALWAPPVPDLGFQIVRRTVESRPTVLPFRRRWGAAFGLAAAAVLVLATASAVANLDVRYKDGVLVLRTGWATSDTVQTVQTQPTPATGAAQPVIVSARGDFALVDQRLRALEAAIAAQPAATTQLASAGRMTDAEMLRQVRAIVREAEARQDGAVAQRLLQVWQDFERVRRADVAMLQQGSAQYQGVVNAELARINQAVRVNQLEK